jgi:hypothetical protein
MYVGDSNTCRRAATPITLGMNDYIAVQLRSAVAVAGVNLILEILS